MNRKTLNIIKILSLAVTCLSTATYGAKLADLGTDSFTAPLVVKKAASTSGLPMDVVLNYTSNGEAITLKELVKDKKAVLIDFWATWCGPCKSAIPHLVKKAELLKKQGVEVVGLNLDNTARADKFRTKHKISFPWLAGGDFSNPYAKICNVTTIPRAVLVSASGEVLFNGHPEDSELENVLSSLESRR